MRLFPVVLIVCAGAAIAADQPKQAPAAKTAAATRPAARKAAPDIPADAKKVDDFTYEYTDKDGKTWYYRRTPFGVMRSEKRAPDASSPAEVERTRVSPFAGREAAAGQTSVTAVETEESVTFTRTTPFGKQTWTRRKAEMTDADRALLEQARKQAPKAANNANK